MENLDHLKEDWKGDKKLRRATYITLGIIVFVVAAILINPIILILSLLGVISVGVIGLLFVGIYSILDSMDDEN